MPLIVKNPYLDVFERWRAIMEPLVGEGNLSMEQSSTIANDKTKYAQMYMASNTTASKDLEGDETSTQISFQTDVFASGSKALSKVYTLDDASKQAMIDMGFRCDYSSLIQNVDSAFKRVTSRYSMTYCGSLLDES